MTVWIPELVGLLLLAGVLITLGQRLWLHGILAALVAAGLWLILFPPLVAQFPDRVVRLLTGEVGAGRYGYRLKDQPGAAQAVADLAALVRQMPDLARIDVHGPGLSEAGWREMTGVPIRHLPNQTPEGVSVDVVQPSLAPGEPMMVRGRLQGSSSNGWTARLLGPGELELGIATVVNGRFEMTYVPRVEGPQLYRLLVNDQRGRVRYSESLPVFVRPADPVRARLVLSRPSFEANAIRRWLEVHGAQLQVQTRLSRGVIRHDGVGDEPGLIGSATQDLSQVDLLIVDAGSLAELGESDQRQMDLAIRGGLGVLVLAGPALLDLAPERLSGLKIGDRDGATEAVLADDGERVGRQSLGISATPAGSLIKAASGETLVAVHRRGHGALAISLVNDSFSWPTNGREDRFADWWANIIESVIRPHQRTRWLQASTGIPTVGERIEFCQTDLADSAGQARCEAHYPRESGWFAPVDGVEPLYVFAVDDWRSARSVQNHRDTAIAAQRAGPARARALWRPMVDPGLMFLGLLMLMAALWLTHKLRPG